MARPVIASRRRSNPERRLGPGLLRRYAPRKDGRGGIKGSRQIAVKILPRWIARFDQRQLFLARLYLFFPADGAGHCLVELVLNQQLAPVTRREPWTRPFPMLPRSPR